LIRGAALIANSRHSSDCTVIADAASIKLAHVPTQITPHRTWVHNTTDLITIARRRFPFSPAAPVSPIEISTPALEERAGFD